MPEEINSALWDKDSYIYCGATVNLGEECRVHFKRGSTQDAFLKGTEIPTEEKNETPGDLRFGY